MRKLSLFTLCLAFGCLLVAVRADDTPAAAAATATVPEVDHMVYLSFLPEPSELMQDAKTNGLTILRLDKTADKVVVSYKYPDGHIATLGYALLSAAGQADRVTAARRVAESTREPEIIYVDRPYRTRVVYRDPVDDFWFPLTLGLGLGWVATSGHYHGHYYGGYHGGWHHR